MDFRVPVCGAVAAAMVLGVGVASGATGPGTLAVWYDKGRTRVEVVREIREGRRSVNWEIIVDSRGIEAEVLDQNVLARLDLREVGVPWDIRSDAAADAVRANRETVGRLMRDHPAARGFLEGAWSALDDAVRQYEGGSRKENGIWFTRDEVERLRRAREGLAGQGVGTRGDGAAPAVAAPALSSSAPAGVPMEAVAAHSVTGRAGVGEVAGGAGPPLGEGPGVDGKQTAVGGGAKAGDAARGGEDGRGVGMGMTGARPVEGLPRYARRPAEEQGSGGGPPPIVVLATSLVCCWFGFRLLAWKLSSRYFVVNFGEVTGPFTRREVQQMVEGHKVPRGAFFFSRKDKTLRPISEFPTAGQGR